MSSTYRMLKSRLHPPAEEPDFSLHSPRHIEVFMKILKLARTPEVTIHFEVLHEEAQRLTLHCPSEDSTPRSIPPSPRDLDPQPTERLYAVASYTKILINAAFASLLCHDSYRHLKLSWQTPACDLFNEIRRKKGKSTIKRIWGNPELRQLLVHFNGFAPMNRYLFAPDGTFVMSKQEFLQAAPRITEDRYKDRYPNRGWQEYSNGNHIFAGMILEEITNGSLQESLQELLFERINLTNTVVSEAALAMSTAEASIVVGFHFPSEKGSAFAVPRKYLSDTVEAASLGARSSIEDLAKFNRYFLRSLEDGPHKKFSPNMMTEFFRPDHKISGGGAITLGGLFTALNLSIPGEESLNQTFRKLNHISSYRLGRRPDGSSCDVYYKGGSVDGFSSTVYLLLNDRSFLIVLGNSSGPIDPTDHIARYILQEAFQLRPRANVVDSANREFELSLAYINRVADEDMSSTIWSRDVKDLAGQYEHTKYTQRLTIAPDGSITVGREKKSSPMTLVYRSPDKIRILKGNTPFGCERWSAWDDLEFLVCRDPDGNIELIGNHGKDCFRKVEGDTVDFSH